MEFSPSTNFLFPLVGRTIRFLDYLWIWSSKSRRYFTECTILWVSRKLKRETEGSARKHFKYSGERKTDSIKANRKPVVEKGLTRPGSSISNLDAPSIVTSFSFSREPLLADAGFKIHDTNNTFNTWPVAASSFTMSSSDTTSLVFTEAWRRTCRLSQLSKIIEVNTISKLLIKKKKKIESTSKGNVIYTFSWNYIMINGYFLREECFS